MKKWEIQVIVFTIMLTNSSENIRNPISYTGKIDQRGGLMDKTLDSALGDQRFESRVKVSSR